jgi:hypothetical protein
MLVWQSSTRVREKTFDDFAQLLSKKTIASANRRSRGSWKETFLAALRSSTGSLALTRTLDGAKRLRMRLTSARSLSAARPKGQLRVLPPFLQTARAVVAGRGIVRHSTPEALNYFTSLYLPDRLLIMSEPHRDARSQLRKCHGPKNPLAKSSSPRRNSRKCGLENTLQTRTWVCDRH